jgi:spermidine/putrescine transport system ATP-binding protein
VSEPPRPTAIVELRQVTKRFADSVAVNRLSLSIAAGEFHSILGPSGCGKTTTLRMLGGFLVPDEGEILLSGVDVTNVPPYRRDVNTVFQSYGLFGHLNVAGNVGFGLKRRKVAKAEIARRVGEMLELVGLADRARAMPHELSGGQQQRVALARALVNMPAVLLLDEPLGALDLKLRREMQVELKTIQREVGITFVFVTHDQEEALTMSDRISVLDGGQLQQVGSPAEIYDRPQNAFVAGFIGASNIIHGRIERGMVALPAGAKMEIHGAAQPAVEGASVIVSIRPEKVVVGDDVSGEQSVRLRGAVVDVVYLGATTHITVDCGPGLHLLAVTFHPGGVGASRLARGDEVAVGWRADDALILRGDTASAAQVSVEANAAVREPAVDRGGAS